MQEVLFLDFYLVGVVGGYFFFFWFGFFLQRFVEYGVQQFSQVLVVSIVCQEVDDGFGVIFQGREEVFEVVEESFGLLRRVQRVEDEFGDVDSQCVDEEYEDRGQEGYVQSCGLLLLRSGVFLKLDEEDYVGQDYDGREVDQCEDVEDGVYYGVLAQVGVFWFFVKERGQYGYYEGQQLEFGVFQVRQACASVVVVLGGEEDREVELGIGGRQQVQVRGVGQVFDVFYRLVVQVVYLGFGIQNSQCG